MDGVVGNWKEYVKYLDEYDMVADNWKDVFNFKDLDKRLFRRRLKDKNLVYPQHFSTQMWWTKSSYLSKLESPFEHQKYALPEHGNPRIIMEGWLNSYGKNFKEIRNDFTYEP